MNSSNLFWMSNFVLRISLCQTIVKMSTPPGPCGFEISPRRHADIEESRRIWDNRFLILTEPHSRGDGSERVLLCEHSSPCLRGEIRRFGSPKPSASATSIRHDGCFSTGCESLKDSASARALSCPRALFNVSSYSLLGRLSATRPAPTWT